MMIKSNITKTWFNTFKKKCVLFISFNVKKVKKKTKCYS